VDYRVEFSEPALIDFRALREYGREAFPAVADRFVSGLTAHIGLMQRFPRMGTTVSKRPGVRRIVHWPYAVYYEIDAAAYVVTILHIWHGKRDSE